MSIDGGVNLKRYLPAFVSQRRTKLAADGVDDCRVIAAQALAAGASAGETQRTDLGHEMGLGQLTRQAVAMRDNLDRDEQTGPLNTSHTTRMIELMWPQFPLATPDDIRFSELLDRLFSGLCASVSGNPSRIKGPSPLKRAGDVGHEFFLMRARVRSGDKEVLVYDPYRVAGKGQRGEWRPAAEVRQFAYKASDQDLLAVFTERIGAWTAESLMRRRKNGRIARIEESAARTEAELRARIIDLEATVPPDCADEVRNAKAAGRESAFVQVLQGVQAMRTTEGP